MLVIGNSPDLANAIAESLLSAFDAVGTHDPRAVREYATGGPIAAVLVTAGFPKPDPEALAAALKPALPGTCLIQVCGGISALPEGSNYHGTLKFPLAPRVLAANVRRMIRTSKATKSDHRPLQAEIELRCLGLSDQTHYKVLGVPPDAPLDDITAAYDSLSLRYHPDRLRKLEPESREHAMQLYIRIGDAYRTLRVVNDRMRYDHALQSGVNVNDLRNAGGGPKALEEYSQVNGAKKYLKLAHKAISAKTPKLALPHLRFALTLDEGNPLIARKIEEIEKGG